jgi:hypothetical protein
VNQKPSCTTESAPVDKVTSAMSALGAKTYADRPITPAEAFGALSCVQLVPIPIRPGVGSTAEPASLRCRNPTYRCPAVNEVVPSG